MALHESEKVKDLSKIHKCSIHTGRKRKLILISDKTSMLRSHDIR